jgi:hypothetical protein
MEPNRLLNLFAGIAVARREGVPDARVAQVAIPALFFPNLALGVIVVDRLAKQEVASEAAASPPSTTGTTTTGTTSTTGSAGTTTGSSGGVSVIGGSTGGGARPLPFPTAYPIVSLQPVVQKLKPGQTLVVDPGQWAQIPADATPTFQWFRGDSEDDIHEDIDKATKPTYEITKEDVDKYLSVEVTYQDPHTRQDVSTTSAPIAVGTPPPPTAPPTSGATTP